MAFPDLRFLIKPPVTTPKFVEDDLPPVERQSSGFPAMNLLPPIIPPPVQRRTAFTDLPPVLPPMNIQPDNIAPPDLPPVGRGEGVGLSMPINAPTVENAQRLFAPGSLSPGDVDLPPAPKFPIKAEPQGFGKIDLPPILPPAGESQITADKLAAIENKRYGFQKDANGNVLRDANNKPLYEKDRDTDHNWWDVVKSAGLGFANGGIGGAIAGGVQGAFDRNADEKMIDRLKTVRLNETYADQVKREDAKLGQDYKRAQIANVYADNETAATNAQTRRETARRNAALRQLQMMKRYKRGENPAFDERLERLGIEQPDFEPGKKLKARYWDRATGRLMTFDDNNATVPVTTPDGKEITNESQREVESGGYMVMPNIARSADAQVEASRVGAVNKTGDNQNDYDTKVAGLKGKIAAANARATSAKAAIAALANPQTQEDYNKKTAAQKDLSAAESDAAGYQTELSNLPKPVQVQSVTGGNVGTYNEAQFRRNFEGRKTPQEIETLVQAAKRQGIIK